LVVDQDYQKETDLTGSFEYDLGSHQQGALAYQLPGLSEGDHLLAVKAWDNANNSSVKELGLRVSAEAELELTDVMNYPNPFDQSTNFYYRLSQAADRVEIKIFTEAGKLIRHIPFASARAGYNFSTGWNGEDQAGDEVSNGIYIYKITAQGTVNGQRKMKEAYGKAVVVR
jgi:flagellar hook assembly protein FlgD